MSVTNQRLIRLLQKVGARARRFVSTIIAIEHQIAFLLLFNALQSPGYGFKDTSV